MTTNQAFINSLRNRNFASYGTDEGRGLLQLVPRSFEHRWIYVFELLQNALDCGATSVRFEPSESELIVEHNGGPLKAEHVESLSKVGRSTKGAATVGFMGVGFKSVFGRFRHVAITTDDWRFRFNVEDRQGELGERIPDPIGMVLPFWDEDLEPPSSSFTTRFRFRESWGEGSVESDLIHIMSNEHPDGLVPLALQGLRRLAIGERLWELDVQRDTFGDVVTASASDARRRWRCFERIYSPTQDAVVVFLQHRSINVTESNREQVYRDASRERKVVAFCSIDDQSNPIFRDLHGQVFAVLPTDVRIPIGLHLQADWLLNLSRTGTRDTEDNQWQQQILQQVPHLLRSYLEWLVNKDGAGPGWCGGYAALPDVNMADDGRSIVRWFGSEDFKSSAKAVLKDADVFPYSASSEQFEFALPTELAVLPQSLSGIFSNNVSLHPAHLFGTNVLATDAMGQRASRFLESLSLVPRLTAKMMTERWKDGLGFWLEKFNPPPSETQHLEDENVETAPPARIDLSVPERQALSALYAGLQGIDGDPIWRDAALHIVPTRSNSWKARANLKRLDGFEFLGKDDDLWSLLSGSLPDPSTVMDETLLASYRSLASTYAKSSGKEHAAQALEFLQRIVPLNVSSVVEGWWSALPSGALDDATARGIARFTIVAIRANRSDLVKRLLVDRAHGKFLVDPSKAYIGSPFVNPSQAEARREIFGGCDPLSQEYCKVGHGQVSEAQIAAFCERCQARGPVILKQVKRMTRSSLEVEQFLHKPFSLPGRRWISLVDYEWSDAILPYVKRASTSRLLVAWIGQEVLPSDCRCASVIQDQGNHVLDTKLASWLRELHEYSWMPCNDGACRRPGQVLWTSDAARPDAPTVALEPNLRQNIAGLGLEFGTDVPDAPAIQRLSIHGPTMDVAILAATLNDAILEAEQSDDNLNAFVEALSKSLFPIDGTNVRLPIDRIVQRTGSIPGARSNLNGFVAGIDSFDEQLHAPIDRMRSVVDLPLTTTGDQALSYLSSVWQRAATGGDGLANLERQHLPLAYRYVLEDMDGSDGLREAWQSARPNAFVFADRRWVPVGDALLWYDDTFDGRLRSLMPDAMWSTGGHLGELPEQQLAAARMLGVQVLSDHISRMVEPTLGDAQPEWEAKFFLLQSLFARKLGFEDRLNNDADLRGIRSLVPCRKIAETVTYQQSDQHTYRRLNAYVDLEERRLYVGGKPRQFAIQAAELFVDIWRMSQQSKLALRLGSLLEVLDDDDVYTERLRAFTDDYEIDASDLLPPIDDSAPLDRPIDEASDVEPTDHAFDGTRPTITGEWPDSNGPLPPSPPDDGAPDTLSGDEHPDDFASVRPAGQAAGSSLGGAPREIPEASSSEAPTPGTQRPSRPTSVPDDSPAELPSGANGGVGPGSPDTGGQPGVALPTPSRPKPRKANDWFRVKARPSSTEPSTGEAASEEFGDDARGRDVVIRYESLHGRSATPGAFNQSGFDITSIDSPGGLTRRIELKGVTDEWDGAATVSVSGPQFDQGRATPPDGIEYWLYIVDRLGTDRPRVYPIRKAMQQVAHFYFQAQDWKEEAIEPAVVDFPLDTDLSR